LQRAVIVSARLSVGGVADISRAVLHPGGRMGSRRLEQARLLAARNPGTMLVIDHLGLQQPFEPPVPTQPFADLSKLLDLAAHDNIGVKVTGLHAVARTFPLQRLVGPAVSHFRCLWLRSLHVGHRLDPGGRILDDEQGVEAFRVTGRLSDSDQAALMGETLRRVYNNETCARGGLPTEMTCFLRRGLLFVLESAAIANASFRVTRKRSRGHNPSVSCPQWRQPTPNAPQIEGDRGQPDL
jgi:hypothetical protein